MNIIKEIFRLKGMYFSLRKGVHLASEFGYCHENVQLDNPIIIDTPQNVFLYENTKLRQVRIINSPNEKVVIKKYSACAPNVIIITGSHVSNVGLPHVLLGSSHINDKSADIIIEEDVWVGAGAILLPGCILRRGCIVGAGAIVNKEVPPYALVVGAPAKIVGKKFDVDQIIEHEKSLYKEEERFSREFLTQVSDTYYKDKKVFGKATILNPELTERIERIKRNINFVEPF